MISKEQNRPKDAFYDHKGNLISHAVLAMQESDPEAFGLLGPNPRESARFLGTPEVRSPNGHTREIADLQRIVTWIGDNAGVNIAHPGERVISDVEYQEFLRLRQADEERKKEEEEKKQRDEAYAKRMRQRATVYKKGEYKGPVWTLEQVLQGETTVIPATKKKRKPVSIAGNPIKIEPLTKTEPKEEVYEMQSSPMSAPVRRVEEDHPVRQAVTEETRVEFEKLAAVKLSGRLLNKNGEIVAFLYKKDAKEPKPTSPETQARLNKMMTSRNEAKDRALARTDSNTDQSEK